MVDSITIAQSFEIFAKYAHLKHEVHSILNQIRINIDSTKIDIDDAVKLDDLGWKISHPNSYYLELDDFEFATEPIILNEGETCLGCRGKGHTIEECPYTIDY